MKIFIVEDFVENNKEKFDLITASSIFEYLDEFPQTLGNYSRMLHDGGLLLYTIPNMDAIHRHIEKLSFRLVGWPKYVEFLKFSSKVNVLESAHHEASLEVVGKQYFCRSKYLPKYVPVWLACEMVLFLLRKKAR